LCAQSSLYGVPAARAPLAIHAAVVGSAMEGPHYIVGGGDAITAPLLARLRELGGELRTRATVAAVTVEADRVTGVAVHDGSRLSAREVILALHPRAAARLMPPDAWRGALRQRLEAAPECVGMVCVYGTVSGELGQYANRNHYLLREDDPDCFYRPSLHGPADVVVNFPPLAAGAPQQFTAMSSALWQWFEPWADSRTARRTPEYTRFKAELTANVLEMMQARLPGLRGRLQVVETATPLTLRDYVGYPRGGLYGLEPSLLSQGRNGVRRRTRYQGLYVTGAGTGAPGVLGACVTGFGVAGAMLGTDDLIRDVRGGTETGATR
jgi:all-trans-retinol 13,14-reductase